MLFVLLVCEPDKSLGRLAHHRVDVRGAVAVARGLVVYDGELKQSVFLPVARRKRRSFAFVQSFIFHEGVVALPEDRLKYRYTVFFRRDAVRHAFKHRQRFHTVSGIRGDKASRAAARPAVLIVKPRFHSAFAAVNGDPVAELEPLFAEILGNKSRPAVHEVAAEAHLFENVDLSFELVFFEFAVPGPKRLAPKLAPGHFELTFQRVYASVRNGIVHKSAPRFRKRSRIPFGREVFPSRPFMPVSA